MMILVHYGHSMCLKLQFMRFLQVLLKHLSAWETPGLDKKNFNQALLALKT